MQAKVIDIGRVLNNEVRLDSHTDCEIYVDADYNNTGIEHIIIDVLSTHDFRIILNKELCKELLHTIKSYL